MLRMIDHIRTRRRVKTLTRMADSPRTKRLPPLDSVRTMGIVLPTTLTEEELGFVRLFEKHMNMRDIVVSHYRLPAPDDKEAMERTGLPKPGTLGVFAARSYDVLIAVAPANDHRTLFAVLSTQARLRVAYDDTTQMPDPIGQKAYDLFIRGRGPCRVVDYLSETLTVLSNIKE